MVSPSNHRHICPLFNLSTLNLCHHERMVTARSTPNIALIKYWGNRNDAYRLPAADSCSITLDTPSVEVTVEYAPTFHLQSFLPDGSEKILKEKDIARIEEHLKLTKEFLALRTLSNAIPESVSVVIRSAIPPAIGIASSAAVFSALAKAYAGLAGSLADSDTSIIARLGSGSAARSIYGGFVALANKQMNQQANNVIDSAIAEQIAPQTTGLSTTSSSFRRWRRKKWDRPKDTTWRTPAPSFQGASRPSFAGDSRNASTRSSPRTSKGSRQSPRKTAGTCTM